MNFNMAGSRTKQRALPALACALVLSGFVAGPASAGKLQLKTAGDKCKKAGDTAAALDGHVLKCGTTKTWSSTPDTVPEKDMPGGKPNAGALYPSRVDQQKEDQEAKIGQPVRLTGRTVWVLSSRLKGKVLSVQVKILNRDSKAKSYNPFDWKVQTPEGQVLDVSLFSGPSLGTGDLVNGGTITGTVSFEVASKGPFFVIYKADPFNAARGIWMVP